MQKKNPIQYNQSGQTDEAKRQRDLELEKERFRELELEINK